MLIYLACTLPLPDALNAELLVESTTMPHAEALMGPEALKSIALLADAFNAMMH
jgi:hypothetical protein